METAGNFETDKKDLLGRIETLKTQLKDYEKELGINSENFMSLAPLDNEDFMGRISKPVHLAATGSEALESLRKQAQTGAAGDGAAPAAMEDRVRSLREQVQQVQEMSQLLSKLKSGLSGIQVKPQQQGEVRVTPPIRQQEQAQSFSREDVPSLNLLIKRLNDLIKTNSAISSELREIIDETKNVSKSARISDLVKKLAAIGING